MKSGYHQIEIEEKHRESTAFTVEALWFYLFSENAFWINECAGNISETF